MEGLCCKFVEKTMSWSTCAAIACCQWLLVRTEMVQIDHTKLDGAKSF